MDGHPNQPQQNSLAGLVSLCWGLVGVFVVLLAFGGLQASKHTLCWGVLRVCAVWFIVGWVHALWISAKQTSWWVLGIGSLLPCGGLHVLWRSFQTNIVMLGRVRIFVVGQCWLCVLGSLLGVSDGLWWLACSVKRLSNKIHYAGSVTGFCGLAFQVREQVSTYSLFWRGNLPFLLVWCVPFLQMLWRICWNKKVRC